MTVVSVMDLDYKEVALVEFRGVEIQLDDSPFGRVRVEFPTEKPSARIRRGDISEASAKEILRMLEKGMKSGQIEGYSRSWTAYTAAAFAKRSG
jgi:hypothetical protein